MNKTVISLALIIFSSMACSGETPCCYPHDSQRRDLAKVYLIDDSRGQVVTIKADVVLIWRGMVNKSDKMPNIHTVGIPENKQEKCRVRISGGPYQAQSEIDWKKGESFDCSLSGRPRGFGTKAGARRFSMKDFNNPLHQKSRSDAGELGLFAIVNLRRARWSGLISKPDV